MLAWADNHLPYCVIRMPDAFPAYDVGSDLDVLCDDAPDMVAYTATSFAHKYPQYRWKMTPSRTGHLHFDALDRERHRIHFRFDFIDSLDVYPFCVDDALKDVVLANRVWDGRAWVPTLEHELALRYMEWKAYPRKEKHLRFIKAHTVKFMHILERYVDF